MKAWRDALEQIAACNNGEGHMPKLAQEALQSTEECRESPKLPFEAWMRLKLAEIGIVEIPPLSPAERDAALAKLVFELFSLRILAEAAIAMHAVCPADSDLTNEYQAAVTTFEAAVKAWKEASPSSSGDQEKP